jgi:WG containing repeat
MSYSETLCAILFGQMISRIIIFLILLTISNLCWGQGNGLYKFIGKNGKYGFIDKNGTVKVKPIFLVVHDFSEGLCFASKETIKKGYKWICIDTIGNKIFDIEDNFPETDFSEGFARISSFTEHWFIDKAGRNVFKKSWKDGQANFKNGIAYVSDEEFINFYPIDSKGNRIGNVTLARHEVYSKQKDSTSNSVDSLIAFKQDTLWGFKNLNGEIIITPKFQLVDKFENGLCGVRLNHQRFEVANDYYLDTIINEKGEIVSQQPMHCYLGFQGELIEYYGGFHFSGGVHYLDKRGQRVIPKE